MGSLVLILIGLMFVSLVGIASYSYIDSDVPISMISEYDMIRGISAVSSSVSEYDIVNGEYPLSASDLTDGGYMSHTPSFTNNTSLMEFSSGSVYEFYFCFGGDSVNRTEYLAYESLIEKTYSEKLLLVSDCDVWEEAEAPTEFPASLMFRYNYSD